MAPVIWGLDLAEFKWGRFKSGYMFGNTDYHLRRTKFIVYQLAMIFCVVSESLGTAALSDYLDQETHIRNRSGGLAQEHNNDIIGVFSFNIFFGIFNAFVFGAAFFFDLQWPERKEIPGVRLAWKICSVLCCIFGLADLIAITVIVSSRRATVTGVSAAEALALLNTYSKFHESPLIYHHNGRAVASLVFIWLGYPFVIYSTIIMWLSLAHDQRTGGPFSTHAREARGGNDKDIEIGSMAIGDNKDVSTKPGATVPVTSTSASRYDGAADMPPAHGHNTSDASSMTAVPGATYDPAYQPFNKESGPTQPYPGT